MESWRQRLFRGIPKVDEVLAWPEVAAGAADFPRWALLDAVRATLALRRGEVTAGTRPEDDPGGGRARIAALLLAALPARGLPHLRPLINATGIIVHTNLGRAPLAPEALAQIERVARGYSNLEYAIEAGERGSRQDHCEELLRRLTGAAGALALNNNAAAVFLCLNTLAEGREVVVSRGQLVEIGGSFRIPDVMRKSGALLREVGTTNRTRTADYRDAITAATALLLRVHTSNFRVVGFTAAVDLPELVAVGRAAGVPVMDDLGSGSLVDLSTHGLPGEPTVQAAVAAGADLVTFSGDKLLGGPQAGLIVGRRDLIERVRKNPLHRAMRIDKLTLAGLEATLRLYLEGERVRNRIPTLRMIAEPLASVRARARRTLRRLAPETRAAWRAAVVPSTCQVGGGALPVEPLPSAALCLGGTERPAHHLEEALRRAPLPVIGRVQEGRLLLDLRTVADAQVAELAAAVDAAARSLGSA
ncbi:MAG TPA: L-seryl-tRNA(Sec) selenium transferase [Candidatus Methanoperedens sp.]|nr:L-seryl-tRNA(Sec) selenium transferase [Candidatus Methanoperedens sp.]